MNGSCLAKPEQFDRIKLFGFSLRFRNFNKSFTGFCSRRVSTIWCRVLPDTSDLFERKLPSSGSMLMPSGSLSTER